VDRRSFGTLMVATLAGMMAIRPASAENAAGNLEALLRRFKAFPGTTSFRIDIGDNEVASRQPLGSSSPAQSRLSSFASISATSRRAVFPRMNSYL
jgi:hypothetical protein